MFSNGKQNLDILLREPLEWFGVIELQTLPEKVKLDFIEASRCYAAGFYRAAAFFTVRGTETVIGKYYEAVAKKSPGKKTWGPISEDIQKNLRLWGVPEELATEVKKWLTRAMTLYITETIMKPEIISKELKLWE